MKKSKRIFERLYLANGSYELIKFAVGSTLPGDNYNAKKMVCFGEGAMEPCTREKAVFFLPANILMVWHAGLLGHTTYYRVS